MLKFRHSVKSAKENVWIMDPLTIADVYGPEVNILTIIYVLEFLSDWRDILHSIFIFSSLAFILIRINLDISGLAFYSYLMPIIVWLCRFTEFIFSLLNL